VKVVFIADAFVHQIYGGGELVNEEIIKGLETKDYSVKKVNSQNVTFTDLKDKNSLYLIGNFLGLNSQIKSYIQEKLCYYIIEHDHKYVIDRDVSLFKNHIAPKNRIINHNFYKNAKRVYCQSQLHCDALIDNLGIDNVINLSTSIWSEEHLNIIEKNLTNKKNNKAMVLGSPNPTKNTNTNRKFCITKGLLHDVVGPLPYESLMRELSSYQTFVFIPKVLETFNRLIVEAQMLNCRVITNDLNGCTSEPWFGKIKGKKLIDFIRASKKNFINKFTDKSVEFYKKKE
jgi:hypothetical protein